MNSDLTQLVRNAAQRLPKIDDPDFAKTFDSFGKYKVVLIGDASHGTSEFYTARAVITKHLITHHDFTHVCIEGDWPDARSIDRYVRQHPVRGETVPIRVFDRFPRWMWRNREVQEFVDWLRTHNAQLPYQKRTSFNGLDLYSMGDSIRAVIDYLDRVNPELAQVAKKRYACLQPWVEDPSQYGLASLKKDYKSCEAGVIKTLQTLLSKRMDLASHPEDGESYLDAEMNARLIKDSEKYYRAMYYGDAQSWNLRDTHMFDVLSRLLKLQPGSKAIVWAHNSHVGDARASSMGYSRGEINIGQLCRQHFPGPNDVGIIGCGTHTGTVAAAEDWDEPMEVMDVVPSREDSYERIMHDTVISSFLLDLRKGNGQSDKLLQALEPPRLQRFIGVIYRPDTERASHYMKTKLPLQYDAYVWFDKTTPVRPFEKAQPKEGLSKGETYPFGL